MEANGNSWQGDQNKKDTQTNEDCIKSQHRTLGRVGKAKGKNEGGEVHRGRRAEVKPWRLPPHPSENVSFLLRRGDCQAACIVGAEITAVCNMYECARRVKYGEGNTGGGGERV